MAGLLAEADHPGMNTCFACTTFPRPSISRRPVPIPRPLYIGLLLLSAAHLCSAQRLAAPSKSHTQVAVRLPGPGLHLLTISTAKSTTHGWRSLFTSSGSSAPHHGEGFHPGDGLPVDDVLDWYKRARSFRHIAALPRRQNLSLLANATAGPARIVPRSLVSAPNAAVQTGNPPPNFLQRLGNALPDWLAW